MSLIQTQERVRAVLTEHEEARNSDNVLYMYIIKDIAKDKGIELEKLSAINLLSHMKEYGFPPFETVRRTRQKLQQHNEELRADAKVDALRYVVEQEYLDYVRDKYNV